MGNVTLNDDLQDKLDSQMQEGYRLEMRGDSVAASRIWIELWKNIKVIMSMQNVQSLEELDQAFHGLQSIYNWASDFEMELGNASRTNKTFARYRIEFCIEYIDRYDDKNDLNILGMKRAIAETLFELERAEEGEQLFREYLKEKPTWAWGWIGWSDQYWLFAQDNNRNSEKAIKILKQALEVEGLEDRLYVLERLDDLYSEFDMHQESIEIRQEMIEQERVNNAQRSKMSLQPIGKPEPGKSTKIGRNDPCPCGSGKKYKKCCGKNS
jgi:tetratricopeptide (TPR) repeat protein